MIKNIFDITVSILLLSISFPFLLIIAFIIWLELHENPFYVQRRGLTLRKQFYIYKFKTLKKTNVTSSSAIFYKKELREQITRTGRILRITGLDELPQLINAIKGEMSLIGPRPLSIEDLKLLKEKVPDIYERRSNLISKPGISGMWQIYGDRSKGVENLIELDELYEKKKNLFIDINLLFKTIPLVLTARHSDSIISCSKKEFSSTLPELLPDRY